MLVSYEMARGASAKMTRNLLTIIVWRTCVVSDALAWLDPEVRQLFLAANVPQAGTFRLPFRRAASSRL